jgi:hypothetical protein
MATWVVGDIHGCAEELARLLERLAPRSGDRLVAVGDLFHRGPDPAGVVDLLERSGAHFVLGNHELAILRRAGLAPLGTDPLDRPPLRERFPELEERDLDGDGGSRCRVEPERRAGVLRFLQRHSGFVLRSRDLDGAGPTRDGREWCAIHAGVRPGIPPERNAVRDLVGLRRLDAPGKPWWYERYEGPELVLFGHTPSPLPRARRVGERLVALGLDTGCVYGGRLSAYSPELDELVSVAAARAYAVA